MSAIDAQPDGTGDPDTAPAGDPAIVPDSTSAPSSVPTSAPAPADARGALMRRLSGPGLPLLAAALIAVGIPLVAAFAVGGMSIPHDDGWAYSRIAEYFGRTGHIKLINWNRSALIGQFVVLGPLARWIVAQQLFVALLGLVSLAAAWDLMVPQLGRRQAAFGVLVVALWPGFGLLATSFMPDIPALAASLVTLALGRRALERHSTPLLAASAAAGLWGSTVREQVYAVPAAVFATALLSRRHRGAFRLSRVLAVILAFALAAGVFELWRRSLPGGDPPVYVPAADPLVTSMEAVVRGYFTIALPIAPVVLYKARPWAWRRISMLASAGTAVVAATAVYQFRPDGFFPGNYLERNGAYANTLYDFTRGTIYSEHVWDAVVALTCLSGVLLAGLLVERYRSIPPLYAAFILLVFAGNIGTTLTGQSLFDRYWMAIPAVLLPTLLATPAPRAERGAEHRAVFGARMACALGAGAAVAFLSLGLCVNALMADSTRWHAAQQLVGQGIPARDIDAGIEWVGTASPRGAVADAKAPRASSFAWYSDLFPQNTPCYLLGEKGKPRASWTLVRTVTYRTFGVYGTSRVFVYDTNLTGCPQLHAS